MQEASNGAAAGTGQKSYVEFPQLSYRAFSYPGDQDAMENLKKVPGAARLLRWLFENMTEDFFKLTNLYYRIRVDEKNYPSLFHQVKDCCRVLDCPMPELYVQYSPFLNAYTSGMGKTFIVFNSAAVNEYSDEEMRFLIGHELGHIKAGHVLYLTLGRILVDFLPLISQLLPFNIGMVQLPLLAALYEWSRRAEFTADRAGLLCTQDPGVAMHQLSSFSGRLNSRADEQNLDSLISQVKDARESDNVFAKAMLFLYSMRATHPYPILRLEKLREWVASGEYGKIIGGQYARDEDGEHELGRRIPCEKCKRMVNFKLDKCPNCGADLWPEV